MRVAASEPAKAAARGHGAHRGRGDVWMPIKLDEGSMTLTASGARVVRLTGARTPAASYL